jgi:hypothetical protein
VQDVSISNNIFSENRGFQIGYSELFLKDHRSWRTAMHEQEIRITHNLIYGRNTIDTPIVSGGEPFDRVKIYAVNGDRARFGDPLFRDPANQDFRPQNGSPAMKGHSFAGAYPLNSQRQTWWKQDFPPRLVQTELDRSR